MDLADSEIVSLPGGPTRVRWRRSRQARRVSLRIDPRGGAVVVTLPTRASRRAGIALLTDHAGWVSDRLAALPGAISFADGTAIPLHGRDHVIIHTAEKRRGAAWLADDYLMVTGDPGFLARRVADFLRAEARRSLTAYVIEKAGFAEAKYKRLTIKDTRSRWGSCTSGGHLAFSWRLVMAPPFVQEYVAAHEVAHLRHMNHRAEFWRLVNDLTPHTDAACAWLRDAGPRLLRIG